MPKPEQKEKQTYEMANEAGVVFLVTRFAGKSELQLGTIHHLYSAGFFDLNCFAGSRLSVPFGDQVENARRDRKDRCLLLMRKVF